MASLPVVVIEAHGKRQTLARVLGVPVKNIIATGGHFFSTPATVGVGLGEGWAEPHRVPSENVAEALRQAARSAPEVIIATDDDQEGDVIGRDAAQLVLEANSGAIVSRLRLGCIDTASIVAAVRGRTRIQHAETTLPGDVRRVVDRFIGFAMPTQSQPIGRVKTALVGALRAEQPCVYGEVTIPVAKATGYVFTARGVFTKSRWDSIVSAVAQVATAPLRTRISPSAFNTLDLLQQAPQLGGSVMQVMSLMQSLYLNGDLSYPRTRSRALSASAIKFHADHANLSCKSVSDVAIARMASLPTDGAHSGLYLTESGIKRAGSLSKPLHTGNPDDALLRLVARRNSLALTEGEHGYIDSRDVPPELADIGLFTDGSARDKECIHASAQARVATQDEIALEVMRSHSIGRPSTYASHAAAFAKFNWITPTGVPSLRLIEAWKLPYEALLSGDLCRAVDALSAATISGEREVAVEQLISFLSADELRAALPKVAPEIGVALNRLCGA